MKHLLRLVTFPLWFGLATLGFMTAYVYIFFVGGLIAGFEHLRKTRTEDQ